MIAFCRASLNDTDPGSVGVRVPVEVQVLDGRRADLPDWDECGFELVGHRSAVTSWDDEEQIAGVHHPELETLAKAMTGCDHATVTSHIKRGPASAARHADLAPIQFVHSDFAANYESVIRRSMRAAPDGPVPAFVRNGLTPTSFEEASRIVVLQFWRNLGPARMDMPIAFCDARTVTVDDARPFVVRDYAGAGGPDFEALAILAPTDRDRHRWYSYPELTRDEVVAFRTYDTDLVASGDVHFTPHAAFRDPSVPLGSPARSSIELRAVCLYA